MTRLKQVLIFLFVLGVGLTQAQTTSISGVVTDAGDGSPIPGVSVFVKGTTIGTVTNIDGRYNLQIDAGNQTLVFSFIGMSTKEVATEGRTSINVAMESATLDVEEVVVTAYGSKGKVGLKGAISTVSAKELDQMPVASFDQMLQGKTTGLQISSGSGQPGSTSTKVRIRGTASIANGNEPLYILDGVPIETSVFTTLNANDFESVSVLKDASATSIYGSRASNGVILITTKRGKEGKTTVNYRFQQGYSIMTREKFDMMNSSEKLWFEEKAKRGIGWELSPINEDNANLTPEEKLANEQELNRLRGINTDWKDLLTQTGKTQSHEVNMSGGNDKTKFYVSYQNYYQEGIGIRSDLDRHIGRINLDHSISKKVRVGLSTSLGYSKSSRIESEGGIALANPFAAMYLANTYEEPYDEDGNLSPDNGKTGTNALDNLMNMTNDMEETKAVGAFHFEWDIIDGLTFRTQYGMDYRLSLYERWISPESFYAEVKGDSDRESEGSISETLRRRFETAFTNTLDYKKQIGDKHIIGALLGSEYINRKYNGWGFTGYGLNSKLPETPAAITSGTATNGFIPVVSGFKTERALFSLFSIFNYTYNERYTLTGSLRRDGSSAFGENNKFAILYSAGFIWDIKREEFMNNAGWINNLKFRVSYGTTGNQAGIGDFASLTTWRNASYGGEPGMGLASSGDKDLKWEIGHKFNLGLDYNLFNNRLNGAIEVYNDITSDLFIRQTLSVTAGIPGTSSNPTDVKYINAGKMRNRGVEVLINYDVIRNNGLVWSVGTNLSYNENEILSLGQVNEFQQGTSIIREGLPYGSHYIVKWAGVNPANGEPLYFTKDGQITNNYNGDDAIADFGTSEAPFTGGFNTSLSYKGIELAAHFTFAKGFSRFNNQRFFQENPNFAQYNMSTAMLDVWQKPGDVTDIQAIGTERQFSSKDIEDASFLRFRNLILAYNVPSKLLNKTGFIQNLRFYGQGQNLFTWTHWTGFDPEDNDNIAKYEYPVPRTFTFGVDVTF